MDGIARRVITRVRGLGPDALRLAQALAVLGDGGELRHAAAIAGVPMATRRGWPGPDPGRGTGRRGSGQVQAAAVLAASGRGSCIR